MACLKLNSYSGSGRHLNSFSRNLSIGSNLVRGQSGKKKLDKGFDGVVTPSGDLQMNTPTQVVATTDTPDASPSVRPACVTMRYRLQQQLASIIIGMAW